MVCRFGTVNLGRQARSLFYYSIYGSVGRQVCVGEDWT